MSYNLFLDDYRDPKRISWVQLPDVPWVCARDYDQFVQLVTHMGIPTLVSYDCDLCYEHYQAYFRYGPAYPLHYQEFKTKCGIHCLEFLLKLCKERGIKHPKYIMHSKNNFAAPFMTQMIEEFNAS